MSSLFLKNEPVSKVHVLAAKLVLQNTEHILIVEDGAQQFASESSLPILSPDQLIATFDSKTSLHEEGDDGN